MRAGTKEGFLQVRQLGLHVAEGFGQEFQETGSPYQGAQSGALVDAKEMESEPQPPGMGESRPEEETVNAFEGSPLLVLGQGLGAGVFHDAAVGDSRGADGLASPALEAHLPVGDDAVADANATLVDCPHQRNAATGGLGFHLERGVGGTGAEA